MTVLSPGRYVVTHASHPEFSMEAEVEGDEVVVIDPNQTALDYGWTVGYRPPLRDFIICKDTWAFTPLPGVWITEGDTEDPS